MVPLSDTPNAGAPYTYTGNDLPPAPAPPATNDEQYGHCMVRKYE